MAEYMVVHQTIPANTLRSNPVEVPVDVSFPILTHREALFPLNAAMLVGIQLRDHSGLIWPSPGSPSEWITGDNNKAESFVPTAMRGDGPYKVVARMYNEDNTFDRTPEIRFEVEAAK